MVMAGLSSQPKCPDAMRSRRLLVLTVTVRPKVWWLPVQQSFSFAIVVAQRSAPVALRFHYEIYGPPVATVVRVYGEIDIATAAGFGAALAAGLERRPPLLIVDLGGVSFLDAHGLGVLVGLANRASPVGVPIRVVGARPHIYRLFALTRLVDRLDVRQRTCIRR
jgi:anti-anti-sigma factor